jgi:hypothetical protein
MKLQNTHSEYRVWPGLQTTEGRTLGLGPGETGDVAVDEAPADPWLKPAKGVKSAGGRNPSGKGGQAASELPLSPQTPSSGDAPPDDPTIEPAEAEASGKES